MARYDKPEKRIRRILNSNPAAARDYKLGYGGDRDARRAARLCGGRGLSPITPQRQPAQENSAAQLPQFDVASVKRTDPAVQHMMGARVYPGGRLEIFGVSLKALVATAFGIAYWQISGGEAWTDKDAYDIEAKPPENLQSSIKSLRYSWYEIRDKQLRAMLQSLLISRFQLQFHRETRTGVLYLLEQSGKTLRLHPVEIPSAADDPESSRGFESVGYAGGQWDMSDAGMPYLAKFAASFIFHVPVLDRTGLYGPVPLPASRAGR